MKLACLLVLACLLGFHSPAHAAESPDSTESTPVDSARVQAALELFELLGLEQNVEFVAAHLIEPWVSANPDLSPYAGVVLAWREKYASWESLAPDLARMYAAQYTERELGEILAFYRSPTGRKLLELTPRVGAKVATVVRDHIEAHRADLIRMLEAEKADKAAGAKRF